MFDLGRYCAICGAAHPSVHAKLSHNIGMVVMRRVEWTEGQMCQGCLVRTYLKHTGLNLVLGWWGMISFIMTIVFLVGNTVHLVTGLIALRSASARQARAERQREAERAQTDAPAALERFKHTIRMRLKRGEDVEVIAAEIADAANVPHEKAHAFVVEQRAAVAEPSASA